MTAQTVVIILGMHRSGTSCLAGTLETRGLFLGKVSRQNPWNKKGNRENPDIMDLHEVILSASGGRWDNPPANIVWTPKHKASRDRIIASYSGVRCWGFKDPRTLLLIDGWLEAIAHPKFVGTFRHPARVALSLYTRNKGSIEQWLNLWMVYNSRLIEIHDRNPFPIVNFDLDDASYVVRLELLARELGMQQFDRDANPGHLGNLPARSDESLNDPETDIFFDPALRHHLDVDQISLPKDIQLVYQRLLELAA